MGKRNFKGISPVIATILMVLITVGLIAFTYTFLTGFLSTTTKNVENQTIKTVGKMVDQQIKISSVWNESGNFSATITLIGSDPVKLQNVKVFVDGAMKSWSSGPIDGCSPTGTLSKGESCSLNILGTSYASGAVIKVTSPDGKEDEKVAP